MRVVLLGSQSIGASCLQVVLDQGHEVVGVATFGPEAHERWTNAVDELVDKHHLPRLDALRFKDEAELAALRAARPDLILVVGWRWLLPPEVLAVPPLGTVGIHGSLLPRLRGFAPVNWSLIRDEPETGPTLFYIDEGMDTGDVLAARPFRLTDADDALSVRRRVEAESAAMLAEVLPKIAAGEAPRWQQDHSRATFGARRRPSDGEIAWSSSVREVFNLVRGITRPYPGAFATIDGRPWRVWRVAPLPGEPGEPGSVHRVTFAGVPEVVSAADGLVELIDIEPLT